MVNQEIDTIETETLDENFIQEAVLEEARVQEEKRLEEEKKQKNHEMWKKQLDDCFQFFKEVAVLLDDIYEVVPGRSKQWKSFCLVPKGTANQVTYYGKPVNSLRVAMNWNWRAGLDRCSIPNHIQCVTPDLPFVKPRPKEHPEWSDFWKYGGPVRHGPQIPLYFRRKIRQGKQDMAMDTEHAKRSGRYAPGEI